MFPEARWAANAAQMQLHHQRFEPAGKQEGGCDDLGLFSSDQLIQLMLLEVSAWISPAQA